MVRHLRLLCMSMAFSAISSVSAKTEGTWVEHASFDGQTVCILPSSDRCHFMLQSAYYRTDMPSDLKRPSARLYVCDLTNPERRLIPVPRNPGKPLQSVAIARVSPYDGTLVVLFHDGDISIHPKHGEPSFIPGPFSKGTLPGSSKAISLNCSPDSEDVWITTERGVAAIDTRHGRITRTILFPEKISGALRCGDHLLLSCGDRLLAAPDTGKLSAGDFKETTADRELSGLEMVLPLRDGLALTVEHLQTSRYRISLLVPDSRSPFSAPARLVILTETALDTQGVRTVTHPLEANLIPTPDGYALRNGSSLTHIRYTIPADISSMSDEGIRSAILKTDHPSYPSWKAAGRKGFILSEGESVADTVRPEAASAFICSTITYAPGHGLVAANHGHTIDFTYASASVPPLFSILSHGKWSLPSPPYNIPASAGVNPDTYPLTLPNGMAVDPCDPDILWCGSTTGGLARFDLSAPSALPLHLSNGADPWSKTGRFVEIAPVQKNWNRLVKFSDPAFDADGNLWTAFYSRDDCLAGDIHAEFWMLPRCAMQNIMNPERLASLPDMWIKIRMPSNCEPSNLERLLPLSHPSNKGLLIYAPNIYDTPFFIYDHRQTPADLSDDRTATLLDPADHTGRRIGFTRIRRFRENPADGLVWIATDAGLLRIDPKTALDGDNSIGIMGENTGHGPSLSGIEVNDIAFDSGEDRVWIATLGGGLWLLDSATGTVTDIFSTENSPIPSDDIHAVGFNPEEGNLLISTSMGLAEFIPRGTQAACERAEMSVTPDIITPEYKGFITISDAGPDAEIIVKGSAGEILTTLRTDPNGSLTFPPDSLPRCSRSSRLILEAIPYGKTGEIIRLVP